jgi:catechol 2,3-dioxygenase-like lactoylglutathione lyase family enzyme
VPDDLASAVLYVLDAERVAAFYEVVCGLRRHLGAEGFVELRSAAWSLILVTVPPAVAATITVDVPPERRASTPIKLAFDVTSLDAARDGAAAHGGALDAASTTWRFEGYDVCDGFDPEGNVVQLRAPAGP